MIRSSRLFTTAITLALGALALAACGSKATTASSSGGGSGKPTYTIAYQGPLSGGNAQLGLNMKYAVQLAVDNANAGTTFGALPFTLKFTAQDDQGSPTDAPAAAQKILGDSSVVGVVGPAFSGATKASEPFYSQADLATVSPSATAPALAQAGDKNFFRVVADDNAQGPADALYLAKVAKVHSVYALDDASAYASGLVGAFVPAAKADGLSVTHETAPGTTQCQAGNGNVQQYNALAAKIKGSGAQSVFYAGYYCDFALLAKQLRAAGYTGQLMSDDGSLDKHYVSQAGASVADGTVISCACSDVAKTGSAGTFISQFTKLAGFAPGTYSAESYDAANTIISVMKGIGAHVTRAAVVSGLHHVDYTGITKTVKFQSDGNISGTAVYAYKVESGNLVQLGLISKLAGA